MPRSNPFFLGLAILVGLLPSQGLAQDLQTPPLLPSVSVPVPAAPAARQPSESPPTSESAPQSGGSGSPERWLEKVKGQWEAAKTSTEFEEPTKAKLLELYENLVKEIQARIDFNKQIEQSRQQIALAPKELEDAERILRELPADPAGPPVSTDLAQLRARLAAVQADLVKAQQSAKQIQGRIDRRPRQLAEIPERVESLTQKIETFRAELANPAPTGEHSEITKVRQTLVRARMGNAEAERESAEVERLVLQGNGGLLAKRLEIETRRASLLEREIALLSERIQQAEERKQQELARKALLAAANEDDRIQAVIAKNREIAANYNNTELFQKNDQKLRARLPELVALIERVDSDFTTTKKRLEIGGSNAVMGSMMRASHQALPDLRVHQRRLIWAETTAANIALQKIEIDECVRRLADIDARIRDTLGNAPPDQKSRQRLAQEEILRSHLQTQRELYQSAQAAFEAQLGMLAEFDQRTRTLIARVTEFDAFIAERILWVPSGKAVGRTDIALLWDAGRDLASSTRWVNAWQIIRQDFFESPTAYLLAGLAAVAAVTLRGRLRKRLRDISDRVAKSYVKTAPETVWAAAWTLLTAALWPASFALLGHRLALATSKADVCAIGSALQVTAGLLFLIEVLRASCRHSGLATAHFRWRASAVAVLRRNLHWLLFVVVPLAFLITLLRADAESAARIVLSRFAFVLAMAVLSIFCLRVFPKSKAVAETIMGAGNDSWIVRTRRLWYPAAVMLPLVLAALACLGYTDTAVFLNDRLIATLALAVAIVFANALLLRWLYAVRGHLAIEQAKKRREVEAQQESIGSDTVPLESELVDLSVVNQQTRRLLSLCVGLAALMGAVFIWSDVVPAFRMLDRVTFWSKTEIAWEVKRNAETGTTLWEKVERTQPVTLATFAVALLTLLVTVAAAKNLPGLLEISLLARLPLDAGARFAITTVARYAISIVGLILVSNHLGIRWDSVQWLAAAFTVGLGFGLQDIVANFVSGLILLWERPIRIGDIITVGDMNGTVSRIQMRSTTITDTNRKEIIIPNKEFITGRVVNWTLSDRILRIQMEMSIAFGANPEKVAEILAAIARRHPYVLADPPPRAMFDRIGDNNMHFVLNAFVDNVDHASITRHELNLAINRELEKAGVEFAPPQRDVNIRGLTVALPNLDKEVRLSLEEKGLRASA